MHTAVAVRLLHEGHLVGSLNGVTFERREFTGDDLILLKGIADEAALAITNARLYSALQLEEDARARLLHQVISAQEDERMRIARELHDETGQSLSAIILGLEVAPDILKEGAPKTEAHLRDIQTIAQEMLQNIRRLIADLRPLLLDDLGLGPAIAWYGERRLNPVGITLRLVGDGLQRRLPRATETALFRIVQEAMTNIVRHAHASSVTVALTRQEGYLVLEIADDGCGFDPGAMDANHWEGKGLGLTGMRERATILGGQLHVQAVPGHGTTVTVNVPIPESEGADVQDPRTLGG
jgi:signal transduction histidine kinase